MAIINLIISIFLCQIWQGIGAAIGTGIASLLANGLIMDIVYHKKINIDIISYWKNIGKQTLGMLPPFFVGILIMKFIEISSLIQLVLWIVVYSLVYCICVWLFSMNTYEKNLLLGCLKKFKRKIK